MMREGWEPIVSNFKGEMSLDKPNEDDDQQHPILLPEFNDDDNKYLVGHFLFRIVTRRDAPPTNVGLIDGRHFGTKLTRKYEASKAIKSLLFLHRSMRLTSTELLKHPMFWNKETSYKFIWSVTSIVDKQKTAFCAVTPVPIDQSLFNCLSDPRSLWTALDKGEDVPDID